MGPGQALALGLVIVLVVFLAAAYYWYYQTGWERFSFTGTVPYIIGKACGAPSDCSSGEKCVGGACATPCSTSSDCPKGQGCAGGACRAGVIPSWTAASDGNVSDLRFRGCTFTVADPQGGQHSADVTAVLNGMAVAYRGATSRIPRTLYLDRPLNAFSFVIQGVNDASTVGTAADAQKWANCATMLTGAWRSI